MPQKLNIGPITNFQSNHIQTGDGYHCAIH